MTCKEPFATMASKASLSVIGLQRGSLTLQSQDLDIGQFEATSTDLSLNGGLHRE